MEDHEFISVDDPEYPCPEICAVCGLHYSEHAVKGKEKEHGR
jgi:hypothetical protein